MNITNLQRAAQLAEELPNIDKARKALADEKSTVKVVTTKGEIVPIPDGLKFNVINILNCEYERLREEVRKL